MLMRDALFLPRAYAIREHAMRVKEKMRAMACAARYCY